MTVDGTKIAANASKHKAMSYGRMKQAEAALQREVEELFRRAEETDEREDQLYGKEKRGDELPEELARRESRLKKIQEAMALEAEAREKARVEGNDPKRVQPPEKAQRNRNGASARRSGVPSSSSASS